MEVSVLEKVLDSVPTSSLLIGFRIIMSARIFVGKCVASGIFGMKQNILSDENSKSDTASPLNSSKSHPALELFLNKVENHLFSLLLGKADRYNLNRNKWKALCN